MFGGLESFSVSALGGSRARIARRRLVRRSLGRKNRGEGMRGGNRGGLGPFETRAGWGTGTLGIWIALVDMRKFLPIRRKQEAGVCRCWEVGCGSVQEVSSSA